MRRPSPFADLVSFRDAMDRLFDETLFRPIRVGNGKQHLVPALDLYTTPESVVAELALPGVKPEDVDISVTEELVTIRGKMVEEKERTETGYLHKELIRGEFTRTFTVPTPVKPEAAKAVFKDGLLTLTLPLAEQVKPRHVQITAG
jgi:HSP20 family protein